MRRLGFRADLKTAMQINKEYREILSDAVAKIEEYTEEHPKKPEKTKNNKDV